MTNNSHQSKSQKIAANTITLFVRMFVITLVNLYAVRLVFRGLGVMDYGIFNTIASVITVSMCISSTLSVAIQRFYSIAMGHGDDGELNRIFSASVNVVIVLSVIIAVVFESVGLWFVNTQLVIPEGRMDAALCIYHIALAILLLSILQIPFTAAIFAHESMGVYAFVSIAECILRLCAAYMISSVTADRLVYYACALLGVNIVVFLLYAGIAARRYRECRYHRVTDKTMYRKLLSFSGWTLFGAIANIGLIQGSSIMLDIFFGPVIVASFAIALQINAAFSSLSGSMVLSFRPAMIKAYAENDMNYLNTLFKACNKFIVYVLAAAALPIILEMETILELWLGKVSAGTVLFARLIIFYIIVAALHNPITIIMQASGHIREYHLPVESVCLLSVPVTGLLFTLGCPEYFVIMSMGGLCLAAHAVRVRCLKRFHESFSLRQYLQNFAVEAAIIAACATLAYALHHAIGQSLLRLGVMACVAPCLLLGMVYFLGISNEERQLVKRFIPFRKGHRK